MKQNTFRILSHSCDGIDHIKLLYGDLDWVYFPRSAQFIPPGHIAWNIIDDDTRDGILEDSSNDVDAESFYAQPGTRLSRIDATKAKELRKNNFLEIFYPDESKYGHVRYVMPSPVEFWPILNSGIWDYSRKFTEGYIALFEDISKRENRLLQMEFWWEHLRRSDAYIKDCEKIRENHNSNHNFIINAFCGNHDRLYLCALNEQEKVILQKWCIPIEYAFSFLHPETTSFENLLASLFMQTFLYTQIVYLSYEESMKYFAMINERLLLDIGEKSQYIINSQLKIEIVDQYDENNKLLNPKMKFTIQIKNINKKMIKRLIEKVNKSSICYVKVRAKMEQYCLGKNSTGVMSFSISPFQKRYLENRLYTKNKMFFWYIKAYEKILALLSKEAGVVVPNYQLWRDKGNIKKDFRERTRISREMLQQYIAGLDGVDPIRARQYWRRRKIGRSLNVGKATAKRKGLKLISKIEEIAKSRHDLLVEG
ncbi:MAG: hypothetical protein EA399_17730 [Desulfovibrionales bacterium]|nr:MAG: hypothetical protein EA399_17730 [Desulfovibrionales bacterium]